MSRSKRCSTSVGVSMDARLCGSAAGEKSSAASPTGGVRDHAEASSPLGVILEDRRAYRQGRTGRPGTGTSGAAPPAVAGPCRRVNSGKQCCVAVSGSGLVCSAPASPSPGWRAAALTSRRARAIEATSTTRTSSPRTTCGLSVRRGRTPGTARPARWSNTSTGCTWSVVAIPGTLGRWPVQRHGRQRHRRLG